jgi:hypothetical protein
VRGQDDFVDARHEGEDGGVGDQDYRDAHCGQGLPALVSIARRVVVGAFAAAVDDSGVCGEVVVWVGFGVDDGEFALAGGGGEELLHGLRGGVGENDFVAVDMVEGGLGDLGVDDFELVEELFNAVDDFGFDVELAVCDGVSVAESRFADGRLGAGWGCAGGSCALRSGEEAEERCDLGRVLAGV